MKTRVHSSPEGGFSLVGVIVVLGFLLAIVAQVLFSRTELLRSTTKLQATDSQRNVIEGLTAYLAERLQTNLSALCGGNVASLQGMSFSGATLSHATSLNVPATLLTGEPALIERCKSPRFNSDGRLYFCLAVTKSPDLPRQSFGGANYGYVEVAVRPVDVWQREVNCADFTAAQTGQAGLQLYYRAYWADSVRAGELNKRAGYYYAIKN